MDGLNRVFLMGNLGADPELRHFDGGGAVLKLRIACTESWFDKEKNERQERTEWMNVSVFGKRGEGLAKILEKGSRIFVEGRMQTREYEKDGERRFATEVVATEVILAGGPRREQGRGEERGQSSGRRSFG